MQPSTSMVADSQRQQVGESPEEAELREQQERCRIAHWQRYVQHERRSLKRFPLILNELAIREERGKEQLKPLIIVGFLTKQSMFTI